MITHAARRVLFAALLLAHAIGAAAADERRAKEEIGHLLDFVAASSCKFVRNGTEHPADRARDHLAAKYRAAASSIGSAEEFIKHLATQSSAGEPYRVKCGDKHALASIWLSAELKRYREVTRARASR